MKPQSGEEQAASVSEKEIKYRKIHGCFYPQCKGISFLRDYRGWRWCLKHWLLKFKQPEYNKWGFFKTTEIYLG